MTAVLTNGAVPQFATLTERATCNAWRTHSSY
jgi:hypothetical protein